MKSSSQKLERRQSATTPSENSHQEQEHLP
jgi:hypothetical protein